MAYPSGDPQILPGDRLVVGLHPRQGGLVREVLAVAPHVRVCVGQHRPGLVVPLAALPAPTDPPLGFGQGLLRPAAVAGMRDRLPLCRDENHLHPDSTARLVAGQRYGLGSWGVGGTWAWAPEQPP